MPFYAVIFRKTKSGTVADSWDVARELRDAAQNSFAKKFSSKTEAEKYITDFNFKVVPTAKKASNSTKKIESVKTTEFEPVNNSVSLEKDYTKEIELELNEVKMTITSFKELLTTSTNRSSDMKKKMTDKVDELWNAIENKSKCFLTLPSTTFANESSTLSCKNQLFSTSNNNGTDGTDGKLFPSELETGRKLFKLNEKNEVIVFTDGACSKNGRSQASAGAGIWFGNCHPLNMSVKVPGKQTNNNAEIYSVIKAIDIVKATGLSRISIQTDSEFVIKCVTQWMPQWITNGWKTSKGVDVKNKELLMQLLDGLKSMDSVSWIHVPGHKGIIGNEEADKLAKQGVKM